MKSPEMQVKCSVDNCQYFKDQTCHADALEVNAMGEDKAQTSDETCCNTFKKHKSDLLR